MKLEMFIAILSFPLFCGVSYYSQSLGEKRVQHQAVELGYGKIVDGEFKWKETQDE